MVKGHKTAFSLFMATICFVFGCYDRDTQIKSKDKGKGDYSEKKKSSTPLIRHVKSIAQDKSIELYDLGEDIVRSSYLTFFLPKRGSYVKYQSCINIPNSGMVRISVKILKEGNTLIVSRFDKEETFVEEKPINNKDLQNNGFYLTSLRVKKGDCLLFTPYRGVEEDDFSDAHEFEISNLVVELELDNN